MTPSITGTGSDTFMSTTLKSFFLATLAAAGISACDSGGNFVPPAGDYTGVLILTEDDPDVSYYDWGMVTITIGDDGTVTGEVTFFNFGPKTLPPTDDFEVYQFSGTIGPDGFTSTGAASEDDTFSVAGTISEDGVMEGEITADGLAGMILGLADEDENIAVACGDFGIAGTGIELGGNAMLLQKGSTVHALLHGENGNTGFTGTFAEEVSLGSCAIDEGCGGSESLEITGDLTTTEGGPFEVTIEGGFDYFADELNSGYSHFEIMGGGSYDDPDAGSGGIEFGADTDNCWD